MRYIGSKSMFAAQAEWPLTALNRTFGYTWSDRPQLTQEDTRIMADSVHRRPKIHAEMLVGVSGIVIGICALGISLYETSLMREEQRAAIMPLLELNSLT